MASSTSLLNKISDLEARLKAETERRRPDQMPTGFVLESPRRPKPFTNMCTHPTQPGSSTVGPPSNGSHVNSVPPGTLMLTTPTRNMTLGTPPGGMVLGTPPGCSSAGTPPGSSNVQMRKKQWQGPWGECKTPDRSSGSEIERKYSEIMKQTGVLTIDGERVKADIKDLDPLGELGHGTCGYVIKMRHLKSNTLMAVKQMRRSRNNEENKRIIMDLDVVLKSHNCPYIVHCIGTFITSSDVWICMELMATCLDKLQKRLKAAIPENILGKVTVATVKALHYLKEEHGVIHRDVKPSNILLNERGDIKLCDFGISGRLVDSKAKTRSAGCAAYMAPERIDPPDPTQPDYDVRADVWSLGVSLVELATGAFPYKNCNNDFEVLAKVVNDDPPVLPSGSGFSTDFCFLVKQCLIKDHKKRPKYRKLLEYNFIQRYEALQVDVADWYACVVEQLRWSSSSATPPSPGGETPTGFWSFTSP
ncbi:Dual specificity mitogen-activated protein kinase kinase 7 [Lamellibrachia satsuma]|nr:Dual specificity mitogen-activated protein kinase kinase 7 [Lamellibrachia satsuma]